MIWGAMVNQRICLYYAYKYNNAIRHTKRSKMFRNKIRKGFTLIEILLVVGFVAVAGTVVYSVYNKVQTTYLADLEVTRMRRMQAGLDAILGGYPSIPDISARFMERVGIIDNEELTWPNHPTSSNTIRGSWGGAITPYKTNTFGKLVTFQYNDVPLEMCVKITQGVAEGVFWIRVGNKYIKSGSLIGVQNPTPDEIVSACVEATYGGENTKMQFTYLIGQGRN